MERDNAFETFWSHEPYTHFIMSEQFSRERTLLRWFHLNFTVGLHSDIYRPISFKLGMTIETFKLSNFALSWDVCLHSGWQLHEKSKTCAGIVLEISESSLKFSMLPQPVGLLKLMLNSFRIINIQGRGLCLCDYMNALNIGLCPYNEPVWFAFELDTVWFQFETLTIQEFKITRLWER